MIRNPRVDLALLGADPSLGDLATVTGARGAGNPFFVEEMLRDLAERGVLLGRPGAYRLRGDVADVSVPATLQAAIGARIDRLGPPPNVRSTPRRSSDRDSTLNG